MEEERIARIKEMESRLDRLCAWLKAGEGDVSEDYRVLDGYYRSPLWRADFEADEAGKLPVGLVRGVLSEDALYDALTEYESRKVGKACGKKVYFAGSIRGGRGLVELYQRMISYIKREHTVLTEHVGDLSLQKSNVDTEIYANDMAWLKESDLVIAECSTPSLGVGYELAYAERIGKPAHVFYRKDVGLSAMLTGDPYFQLHPYEEESEIYPILDSILHSRGTNM